MSFRHSIIVTATTILILIAGCGKASPTATPPPPTDTHIPATATAPPPTDTLVPPSYAPTATLAPPTPAPPPEIGGVRITIVYDNIAYDPNLKTSWGFAAWIEYGDHTLLFDTGGDGPTLLSNMEKLGLDPEQIETIVLSHEHGDHTGGLEALADTGIRPTVYVPDAFPARFKQSVRAYTDLVEVTDPLQILPGIYSTGQLGGVVFEQALVVSTQEGIVVITGCAHPGIVRIVERAKAVVEGEVALVMGGFHLVEARQSQIDRIIADFREMGVRQVSPTHCTGEAAIAAFADAYGDDYVEGGVGRTVVFRLAPPAQAPAPSDPFALISQDSLFAFLEGLTAIQPYSGWRNSASEGEAEAIDYVTAQLDGFTYLQDLGMDLERQSLHVFLGTELWETRLYLSVNGQEVEVPADGLRSPRDDIRLALRFDSDGVLNDSARDPVTVEGPVVLIPYAEEIGMLSKAEVRDKLVFLNYDAISRVLHGTDNAAGNASDLLYKEPAGLVLVTQFSNSQKTSHGFGVGDVNILNWMDREPRVPTLYARLEDLSPARITSWDDLARVESARLTWDADVFSPAASGNLIAHIPGADASQAIILGAHIDSPNSPGAMDDGSGSVVLLEVARVLNAARVQPPVDLYLAWFGSEELGLYGSAHFILTHQKLLDRTLAMLEIDCLSHPLDGIQADLTLVAWSYDRLGDNRLTWPDYLVQAAAGQGIETVSQDYHFLYSDNTAFTGFGVPNADLIYTNDRAMEAAGGWHYAAHVHDPYDTVELTRKVGDVLEQMARVALIAALETGRDTPPLRVAPPPDRRALFVGSHTEAVHMSPATFIDLGTILAWEGFDVDMIPYGQALTPADLANADLVVALPVLDYPSADGDPHLYDEAWSEEEVAALEAYVAQGGLLVLTNSAYRLKYYNQQHDPNEDRMDVNALADRFGVSFQDGEMSSAGAQTVGEHPLVEGAPTLEMVQENGVPFTLTQGQTLAQAGEGPVVALIDHGDAGGQVLVLADVGMLGSSSEPANFTFWQNLACYARSR